MEITGRKLFGVLLDAMAPEDRKFAEEQVKGRQLAYLCLPFTGDLDLYRAKVECLVPWFMRENYVMLAPYLGMLQAEVNPMPVSRSQAKDIALLMIDTCDVFIAVKDYLTPNVLSELSCAFRRGKKIIYLDEPDEEETHE